MEFGILLRLDDVTNLTLILFVHSILEGENPIYVVSLKTLTLPCIQTFTGWFLSKVGMMIETTKFYILISVWVTLMFIQGHRCMRNQKRRCPSSRKCRYRFGWNSICCYNLLLLSMLMLFSSFLCMSCIQRELCLRGFIKIYVYRRHVSGHIWTDCFKLWMMINTTRRYTWIPVWMTLMFTQGKS